jgi:TonB-linked SusC/RagA family outer membrane protein
MIKTIIDTLKSVEHYKIQLINMKKKLQRMLKKGTKLHLTLCVMILMALALQAEATSLNANEGIKKLNVAQQVEVKGKVTDAKTGDAMPGVNIKIQGTTSGTISDLDGNFALKVDNSSATLIFSFIGYQPQTVALDGRSFIEVSMTEGTRSLDEVVVVGFGTQKKVNLTGSVGTVNAKDMEARPVQNAVQALQGIVPGLNISTSGNGGELNSSKSINIRGVGTISSGSKSDPLVLIDGMEGDLTSINPQDIDNISVLKDAAASSIYGSRAPFGVILITTKKGKKGQTRVNYNNNIRWSSPVLIPEMMDSYSFAVYFNDASKNGGGGAIFNDHYLDRILKYKEGKLDVTDVVEAQPNGKWNYDYTNANVDWYGEYYQKWAPSQEHTMSLSGGNEKWNYYASANYLDQTGLMRYGTDYYDRYAVSAKISGLITEKITFDYTMRFTRGIYSRATYMSDGFYDNIARRARPIRPKYDPNGKLMADVNYIDALENGGRREERKDWMVQQAKLKFTPVKDWEIIGELNFRTEDRNTHELGLKSYAYNVDGINKYQATTSIGNEYVYEYSYKSNFYSPNIYSNYSYQIGNHNLKAMTGFQAEMLKYNDLSASRNDVISKEIDVINGTTNLNPTISGQYQKWATAGFFGRLNYDFDGKYLLEANLRYDGTSRYRENLRWNWFPSVSAGWNIAKEDFWAPMLPFASMFKLRASYGILGNQNTDDWYPTYLSMTTGTANGNWIVGGVKPNTSSAPGTIINTSLEWEKIRTMNVGADISALHDRLTVSFDAYKRYTDNMLAPGATLAAVNGYSAPNESKTNLVTSGFELSIGWQDKIQDLGYAIRVNVADSRTKVTKYNNETQKLRGFSDYWGYNEGYYLNEIWGYTTIGIAKTDQEMTDHIATLPNGGQNALGNNWAAGDIMYEDVNGDGKISSGASTLNDPGDMKILGNSTPRYSFGLDISLDWKGFDFKMFWQGIAKRDYYATGLTFWGATGGGQWWSTAFTEHLDYFRPEGHLLGANLDAYYPRPIFGGKNQNTQTRYLQNAAYARLKNLQLGYTLPAEITRKIKIEKLRVFVSGENLITITKLAKSLDPESVGIGRQGGTVYPLSKVISAGLSVNF